MFLGLGLCFWYIRRKLSSLTHELATLRREFVALRVELDAHQPVPPPIASTEQLPSSPSQGDVSTPSTLQAQVVSVPSPHSDGGEDNDSAAPAAPAFDWERFLGVRAFAIAGGAIFAFAGVLFFKYSIESGLLPPAARVILGVLTGLACIVAAEAFLRKRYAPTANPTAGAGIVVLYASFWAARALYSLIGSGTAFFAMILVTAAACALAIRRTSLVIAVLAMCGGFATPVLLATGDDRPFALFGYIALLDTALLFIAYKRGFRVLALLSLAFTLVYQAGWIFSRMSPERLWLGILVLLVFALLYLAYNHLAPPPLTQKDAVAARRMQAIALLSPFAFVFYFAAAASLGTHYAPIGAMMAILFTGTLVISRSQELRFLPLSAASAIVCVTTVWLTDRHLSGPLAWELVSFAALLAVIPHLFFERDPARFFWPSLVVSGGLFILLAIAAPFARATPSWPWLAGFALLAALLVRQSNKTKTSSVQIFAGVLLGLALGALGNTQDSREVKLAMSLVYAIDLGFALAFSFGSGALASACLSLSLLLATLGKDATSSAHLAALLATLGFSLIGAFASARMKNGIAFALVCLCTVVAYEARAEAASADLVFLLFTVLLLTAWPFLLVRRFEHDRFAWYGAALVAPMFFPTLRVLFEERFGARAIALVPLTLGLVSFTAAAMSLRLWPEDHPRRKSTLVWFLAVALCFVSVAIPLQLEKQWITLGWAIEGAALVLLWARLDHVGLKYFALSLLLLAAIRLVLNPSVLDYYPSTGGKVINWLLYTYWIPTACLLASSVVLRRHERLRLLPWEEQTLYARGWDLGAVLSGVAGFAVFFAWINLTISDAFSSGGPLTLDFSRMPARELTRSLSWAIYAVGLLALGLVKKVSGLRWLSLVMLLVTIAKVFLFDLGELQDLYRVVSLMGLALSLLAVSLAYQRFVFRGER